MNNMIGTLWYKITGDTSGLNKALKTTDSQVKTTGKSFSSFGSSLKKLVATGGIYLATKKIIAMGIATISAASDAEETSNKFRVVFRDISDEAEAAAENLADNFGISSQAAEDLLVGTGDLLAGFGFSQDAALALSDQVNQLAADLGSFQNVDTKTASEALTKALLGERESVKQLGISILDADVKAQVLLNTQNGLTFETERQAKAQATLDLALQQSKNAIGDYARSNESFANQSKEASAAVQDLKVALGEQLLPIATDSVSMFGELTQAIADFIAERNKIKGLGLSGAAKALFDLNAELEAVKVQGTDVSKTAIRLNSALAEQERLGYAVSATDKQRLEELLKLNSALGTQRREILAKIKALKDEPIATKAAADAEAERLAEESAARTEAAALELEQMETRIRLIADGEAEITRLKEEEAARRKSALDIEVQNAIDSNEAIIQAKIDEAAAEELLDQQKLDAANSFFSGYAALTAVFAADNKAAAVASRVLSAAQAGINSYLAFTNVLATGGPFPLNAINAAGVLATGLATQIQIANTSFANGGIVPGTSYTGDNVEANVNSGELVLNKDQQTELYNIAKGNSPTGSQTINISFGNKAFATAVISAVNSGAGGSIDGRIVK